MRHRLFVAVGIALGSSLASAGPSPAQAAADVVNDRLIHPLSAKERDQSKFSRAALPPAERRVRVVDAKPQQDSAGDSFFSFAVDARHGWGGPDDDASWDKATITGCVYPGRGEVFVKWGDVYRPAIAALGKKTKPAAESVCHAASVPGA